jgi:hypothetical protein
MAMGHQPPIWIAVASVIGFVVAWLTPLRNARG